MRFAVAAAAAGMIGAVSAWSNGTTTLPDVYTTEVVTAFTTYCPAATEITHGGSTYTVTSATTLTITNCPCTITHPITSYTPPPSVGTTSIPVPTSNGTWTPVSPPATGSATGTSTPVPTYTGAANKAFSAAGAGFLALIGVAAAI